MAKWPSRVQEIVEEMAGYRDWYAAPDEDRRARTQAIAEQCCFELGDNWGHKRADPGRPPSADVFCTASPFEGWDWSVPGGIAQFPDSIDLTGQTFIKVDPINHLGVAEPPESEPPDPIELNEVWDAIEGLQAQINDVRNDIAEIHQAIGMVVAILQQPMKVTGQTGRSAYHSHSFTGEVKRG